MQARKITGELWRRFGPDPAASLEDRFFHALCLLSAFLIVTVIAPANALVDLDPRINQVILLLGAACIGFAWAASRGRYFKKTLVTLYVLSLDLVWFPNGGSQGSIGLYFAVTTLYVVFFFEGRGRVAGLALILADVLGLMALENLRPELVVPFATPSERFYDLATGQFISFVLGAAFVWVILGGLQRERERSRQASAALLASEARHRLLADNADDVIWTCDLQGRFTYVSPSVERLRGYTAAEALQQTLEEALTPRSAAKVRRALAAAAARIASGQALPPLRTTLEERCKDGSTIWVEVTASGLKDEAGRYVGALGVTRDITERRRAEAERKALEAQMHQVEKMESLGSLAGGVAHDMNNVLGAILGLASAAREDAPPGSQLAEDMATIIGACKRGGALAKGLLTFARKGLAEEREVDLNAVVRETVALLERTTLQRIRLVTDLAGDLQRLRGDPAALSHCLMNLCVNAVDAMPDGGTLTLRTRNQSGAALLLEVEDTGTGMSKEVRDRALEPFFTTKPQGKGTGLGLAMVYSTAQAHGGRLELESEPGKGTRVRLVLPASETQREPAGPVSLPVLQAAVQRRPLLLVDDDPLVRDALRAVLKTLGHPATFASGGEEALLLLAGGLLPDAVILDVNMPGLDGAATLAKLRASGAAVPVILVTGRVDDRALGLVDAYPGVTLLAKPFGVGDLQRHLEATLGPLRS